MTTIWRKLIIVAVMAVVLGTAGINEIVNWLMQHGLIAMAIEYRSRFLSGTAISVIVAMLILLRSDSSGRRG